MDLAIFKTDQNYTLQSFMWVSLAIGIIITPTTARIVRGSTLVVTDSGGIQEETTVLGVPCLTVRPNTERPITISHGTNRLCEPEDVPAAHVQGASRGGAISIVLEGEYTERTT